jgi:hypothetical protein
MRTKTMNYAPWALYLGRMARQLAARLTPWRRRRARDKRRLERLLRKRLGASRSQAVGLVAEFFNDQRPTQKD